VSGISGDSQKESTNNKYDYLGIFSLENNFNRELNNSLDRLGISKDNAESIDKLVIAQEESRMWIEGQKFINGYVRFKTQSKFPKMTCNDIEKYIMMNRAYLEKYASAQKPILRIMNTLLLAYIQGIELSYQDSRTHLSIVVPSSRNILKNLN
jgi:hypothetical protein